MAKFCNNIIFKGLQLAVFISLAFLSVDCFGSFLSLKSSFESQENVLKLPLRCQLKILDHTDSIKLGIVSQCSSNLGKSSRDKYPKTFKFDLNELPEETGPNLGNGIFEKKNEKDYHQALKKQRMDIDHNFINVSEFGKSQLLSTNINILESFEHSLFLKNQPSSSKVVSTRNINLSDSKTVPGRIINWPKKHHIFVDWDTKINSPRQKETNDSKEKRIYQSPYSRDLLNFLKENLNRLMPNDLENYRFTSEFLKSIEKSEETIPKMIFSAEIWAYSKKGSRWIVYSPKGFEISNQQNALNWFNFRPVFTKLYKFENLGEAFFTEEMRVSCVNFFKGLEKKLSNVQIEAGKRKDTKYSILDQIFHSLPGYLVCVHFISEIIRPISLMHERPIGKQEEALNFFIELHSELHELYRKSLRKKFKGVFHDKSWADLSFEEQKRHLSYKIVNFTHLQANQLAWVCVELWLIRYRPKLYRMCSDTTNMDCAGKILKLKIFINKLLFTLFPASERLFRAASILGMGYLSAIV
ncbi:hypothetical protein PPACK8108_LOCUS364 [Phakopsora pachyrhizi]|uniref:Uncharacterized protein n=1 Tax=Phakopsora pachyrhizi TaxID=170000 RepID=A0AAV0AFT6_PHAPC|nr:hypothetical protein PPACK8108_LOCUS364 [Phakopsora pachyrhizi]